MRPQVETRSLASLSAGSDVHTVLLGAAPITLINGEKLIDLLIEYRIGVQKKSVELLELVPSAFVLTADEAEE